MLRHAEAIARAVGTAFSLLFEEEGAAVERIGKAGSLLAEIEAWEPPAAAWRAEVEEMRIRLAETARSLQHRLDDLEADPARLDAVEERLSMIERLCRKHGGDSGAVLARRPRSRPSSPSSKGTTRTATSWRGRSPPLWRGTGTGAWSSPAAARSGGGHWSSGSRGS